MLSLVRPRWFIPIHGERRHLAHHAKIATEVGIPADHVLICEDGDVVEVGEKVHVIERAPAGMPWSTGSVSATSARWSCGTGASSRPMGWWWSWLRSTATTGRCSRVRTS